MIKILYSILLIFISTNIFGQLSFEQILPTGDLIKENIINVSNEVVHYLDIDNDNDQDLVISGMLNSNDYRTYIYKNDGIGNFTVYNDSLLSRLQIPSIIKSADIDNDFDDDLIITIANPTVKSVFFINDGLGNFTEDTSNSIIGVYNGDLGFSDIDGDLDLDLFITGQNQSYTTSKMYLNNGSGLFTEVTKNIDSINKGKVCFYDLDNDGDEDLFLTGYNGTQCISNIYFNDSFGNFTLDTSSNIIGLLNSNLIFKDLNNDQKTDLFITGVSLPSSIKSKIYLGDGTGNFILHNSPNIFPVHSSSILFEDLDGDNDYDLLLSGPNPYSGYSTKIYYNNGNADFTLHDDTFLSDIKQTNIYSLNGENFYSTDLNNDNKKDLIVSTGTLKRIYINNGNGGFEEVLNSPFGRMNKATAIFGDIDLDNDIDVIISGVNNDLQNELKLYYNNGNGTYTESQTQDFSHILLAHNMELADFDNDGDLDFFITGQTHTWAGSSSIYENNGGQFSFGSLGIPGGIGAYKDGDVNIIDIDNDGDLDIFLSGSNDHLDLYTRLYINDGTGLFNLSTNNFEGLYRSNSIVFDSDNDSDLDILISGTNSSGEHICKLYRNDGNLQFNESLNTQIQGLTRPSLAYVDIDEDGDLDLIYSGAESNYTTYVNKVYFNNGSNSFILNPNNNFISAADGEVSVFDIDNDLDKDFIFIGIGGTDIYINQNNGSFSKVINHELEQMSEGSITEGDINNDGTIDFIISGKNYKGEKKQLLYKNHSSNLCNIVYIDSIIECNSLLWNDNITYYSNNNTASILYSNSQGSCDSLVWLNLIIKPTPERIDKYIVCDSLIWIDGNTYYTNNDTSSFIIPSLLPNICDSIIRLDLLIIDSINNIDNITACDSSIWVNGTTYYSSNNSDSLITSTGCKAYLDLNINYTNYSTDYQIACSNYTWLDGNSYNSNNNTATYTLINQAGCDSIITLDITFNSIDTTSYFTDSSITISQSASTYQWLDCNNNDIIIIGETNQTISPFINGTYKVQVSNNDCIDTSSCITITPCKDIEIIHVTDASICNSSSSTLSILNNYDSYSWSNGSSLDSIIVTDSSTYFATLYKNNGCMTQSDSVSINIFDCSIFIDTLNHYLDTCLIDSNTVVMQSFISNLTTTNDSAFITWNFLLNTGDTIFLDAGYFFSQNGLYSIGVTINCNGLKTNIGTTYYDLVELSQSFASTNKTITENLYNLYPNPTLEFIKIASKFKNKNITIDVLSTNGALIKSQTFNSSSLITLDLTGLEKALYFIKISSNNQKTLIYKIIKK